MPAPNLVGDAMSQNPSSSARPPSAARLPWLAIAVSVIGLSGPARAADIEIGISAGVDRGRVDCVASFACDRSSSHVKLSAAYRLTPSWSVEAIYLHAGRFQGGDTTPLGTQFGGTFRVDGVGLSAGYRWTFAPSWSLTGRAGVASVRTRFEYADGRADNVSRTLLQPLVGIGIAYAITPSLRVGIDYDATRFKVHTTRGPLNLLGLAAQFSF
jgi:hypothetical protein